MAGYDFGFAKQMDDEVKGMDKQIKEGITLWIIASEIMEVVINKSLLCEPLPEELYGRSISLL